MSEIKRRKFLQSTAAVAASSALGAGLNYWFVRAWGQRAMFHFRQRHLAVRPARLAEMADQPRLTSAGY